MTAPWRDVWAFRKIIIFILTPILLLPLPLVDTSGVGKCGYVLLLMAVYWSTEVVPVAVTGFIPLLLLPAMGILSVRDVASQYIKDSTVLFICGLIIACAVERWNLHRRIALRVLMLFGSEPRWLMLGMMVPTWFLSMWISNTATTSMMIPIVDAILDQLKDSTVKPAPSTETIEMESVVTDDALPEYEPSAKYVEPPAEQKSNNHTSSSELYQVTIDEDDNKSPFSNEQGYRNLCKAMSLCICYAANVGGIATVIGTGPNVVLLGASDDLYSSYGLENPVSFATWMIFGLPTSILCLFVTWGWLQLFFLRCRCGRMVTKQQDLAIRGIIRSEYDKLGSMSFAEWVILVHFIALALLWFFRRPQFITGWAEVLFPGGMVRDAVPAVLIIILLFIFPAKLPNVFCWRKAGDTSKPRVMPILDWSTVQHGVPWMIIWLLGGGFALAAGSKSSGLSVWIGTQLSALQGMDPWVMNLILTFIAAAVTEVTSNTAIATIIMPILLQVGLNLGVNPLYLMFPAALATSFAFMLPVATPPNAIVYAHGRVSVLDMVKTGVMLNIFCILVLNLATNTWADAFFKFSVLPDAMKVPSTNVTGVTT